MHVKKNPIDVNESFICKKCGEFNPEAVKTCRNHCRKCLFSLHVDEKIPGDRQSSCGNLMEPIRIEQNSKKGYQILHQCQKCGKKILNKAAEDDDMETLTEIMRQQNMNQ